MKKLNFLILIIIASSLNSHGQNVLNDNLPSPQYISFNKQEMSSTLAGSSFFNTINPNWGAYVYSIISRNSSPKESLVKDIKARNLLNKKTFVNTSNDADNPSNSRGYNLTINRNFEGSASQGCPLDNTIAISNGGKIICGVNSDFYFFDENGTLNSSIAMSSFFAPITSSTNLCDPKAYYDSQSDRFILFAQTCDPGQNPSQLLVGFSQSNDPSDGFWIYSLTGDPSNENLWFDYPKLAVSNNELFITGNLFEVSGSQSYVKSVIYQINKAQGYSGNATIAWQFWTNINGSPFTILPLGWGQQGAYGPDFYFISSNPQGSSEYNFYRITDEMSASNEQLQAWTIPVPAYSPPTDASQSGTSSLLDVGDCRSMDGFYLNGFAHFVHLDKEQNWAACRYSKIRVSDFNVASNKIHSAGSFDYSYPAIASFSTNSNDQSALIGFCASGPSIFPEYRVKAYDNVLHTTPSVLVKAGQGNVTSCGSQVNRWGDYSGIARKHSASTQQPTVWVYGNIGGTNSFWNSWAAEITGTFVSSIENSVIDKQEINAYPIPTKNNIYIDFENPTQQLVQINAFSNDGKWIGEMFKGFLTKGNNKLVLPTQSLASGIYFITIQNENNNVIARKKFSISR